MDQRGRSQVGGAVIWGELRPVEIQGIRERILGLRQNRDAFSVFILRVRQSFQQILDCLEIISFFEQICRLLGQYL